MGAPILWTPGKMRSFCRKNHVRKISLFGFFFFWGGGECRFYFYGRADFSDQLVWRRSSGLAALMLVLQERDQKEKRAHAAPTFCCRSLPTGSVISNMWHEPREMSKAATSTRVPLGPLGLHSLVGISASPKHLPTWQPHPGACLPPPLTPPPQIPPPPHSIFNTFCPKP